MADRAIPEAIRITKVGLLYILITLIVGVAAGNTGNNALYLVESCLLALLGVSGVASRQNVRRLHFNLEAPDEVYAKRPFALRMRVANQGRRFGRRLIRISGATPDGKPVVIPWLATRDEVVTPMEVMIDRRGPYRVRHLHISSIFPLGLFQKGLRYPCVLDVLVFPEIYSESDFELDRSGRAGEQPSGRIGWGHELLTLRSFNPGDDPRGIHWKQTARTGQLIFMEREAEKGRRLSILLDNAVGDLESDAERRRFEGLVSEAATAAHFGLERGFVVELVTRAGRVGYGEGRGHRRRILEALARLEPAPRTHEALAPEDPRAPRLRLGMEVVGRVAS